MCALHIFYAYEYWEWHRHRLDWLRTTTTTTGHVLSATTRCVVLLGQRFHFHFSAISFYTFPLPLSLYLFGVERREGVAWQNCLGFTSLIFALLARLILLQHSGHISIYSQQVAAPPKKLPLSEVNPSSIPHPIVFYALPNPSWQTPSPCHVHFVSHTHTHTGKNATCHLPLDKQLISAWEMFEALIATPSRFL